MVSVLKKKQNQWKSTKGLSSRIMPQQKNTSWLRNWTDTSPLSLNCGVRYWGGTAGGLSRPPQHSHFYILIRMKIEPAESQHRRQTAAECTKSCNRFHKYPRSPNAADTGYLWNLLRDFVHSAAVWRRCRDYRFSSTTVLLPTLGLSRPYATRRNGRNGDRNQMAKRKGRRVKGM